MEPRLIADCPYVCQDSKQRKLLQVADTTGQLQAVLQKLAEDDSMPCEVPTCALGADAACRNPCHDLHP